MIFKTQRFSKSPFMLNKKPTPKPYAFFSMHGLGVDVQSFKNGIMTHANQISPQPAIVPCGFASNNQTAAIDIPAQRVYKAAAAGVATYLSHSAPAAFFVSPHPISGYMGPSSPEGQFFPTGVMLVPILLLPYVSVSPYGMQASQDGCSLPGPVQHAQSDPNLQIQEYGSGSASSTGDSSPNSHAKAKMQLKRFWNNWWSMLGHRPDNQIWVAEELNGFQQEVKQILQQPDLSIERFSVQEKINLSEQLADFLNLVIDSRSRTIEFL